MSYAFLKQKARQRLWRPLMIVTCISLFLTKASCVEVAESKPRKLQDPKAPTSTTTSTEKDAGETTRKLNNVFGNPEPDIGPWPECIGWFSDDCSDYIQSETTDTVKIGVVRPPPVSSGGGGGGFVGDPHRVQVRVDEYNVVVAVPQRG